jgi:hypothetical protein
MSVAAQKMGSGIRFTLLVGKLKVCCAGSAPKVNQVFLALGSCPELDWFCRFCRFAVVKIETKSSIISSPCRFLLDHALLTFGVGNL